MKIAVTELREFFKRTSKIKTNNILPVYGSILFEFTKECVYLTKTNGFSFCKHEIESEENEEGIFAIEEKRLTPLVNNAVGEFIEFKLKTKKAIVAEKEQIITIAVISDDENTSSIQVIDHTAFPSFPEQNKSSEPVYLNNDVIKSLNEAKSFCFVANVETSYSYVYLSKKNGGNFIFSTTGQIFYLNKIEDELPEFSLSPESCSMLLPYTNIMYYKAGNYNFFNTGKTVFGFIQSRLNPPNFQVIIDAIDRTDFIELKRQQVIDFSELVLSFSLEVPVVIFSFEESGLVGSYSEAEYNVDTKRSLYVNKNHDADDFALNASFTHMALSCFTGENLKGYIVRDNNGKENSFCIESEENPGLSIVLGLYHTKIK